MSFLCSFLIINQRKHCLKKSFDYLLCRRSSLRMLCERRRGESETEDRAHNGCRVYNIRKTWTRIMQNEQREQVRKRREKNWLCQCATKFMNFKCKYIHIFSMLYYLWNSQQSIKQIFMSNIYRMRCACACCCILTLVSGYRDRDRHRHTQRKHARCTGTLHRRTQMAGDR